MRQYLWYLKALAIEIPPIQAKDLRIEGVADHTIEIKSTDWDTGNKHGLSLEIADFDYFSGKVFGLKQYNMNVEHGMDIKFYCDGSYSIETRENGLTISCL